MVPVGLVILVVGPSVRVVMVIVRLVHAGNLVSDRNGRGERVIVRLVRVAKVSVRIGRVVSLVSDRNGRGERVIVRLVRVAKVSVRIVRVVSLVSDRNGRGERVIVRLVRVVMAIVRFVLVGRVSDPQGRGEKGIRRFGDAAKAIAVQVDAVLGSVLAEVVLGVNLIEGSVRIVASVQVAASVPSVRLPMHNVVPMKFAAPKVAASSSAVKFPTSGPRKSVGSTKVRFAHLVSRALKRASRNDRVLGRFRRPSTLAR